MVVSHCIIHQENLCTKVFVFEEVLKKIFQCVNDIRARGLNHQQFKACQECLDCDCPIVVYFSAVHWLSRAATLKSFFYNLPQETKLLMESKH